MPKTELKRTIREIKGDICALTNVPLPDEGYLYDTDRINPKANGGTYTEENTRLVNPVAHMKRHKTLRLRPEQLEHLKSLVDDREQILKLKLKISNQIRAYKRETDKLSSETLEWLVTNLEEIDKGEKLRKNAVHRYTKSLAKDDPLVEATMSVKGVGPITAAYCIVYIDLEKARHPSNIWSYLGIHRPGWQRYKKDPVTGKHNPGNKALRSQLYCMSQSQVKGQTCAYTNVYYQVKGRLAQSERLVFTKLAGKKGEPPVEMAWKDVAPIHRDGAAHRAVIKHFTADYWFVGRTLRGLETAPLYPEAKLGGDHRIIMPEERGWIY